MSRPYVALTYSDHLRYLIEQGAARGLVTAVEVVPSGYMFMRKEQLLRLRLAQLALPYAFHFVENSVASADFLENNHCERLAEFLSGFSPLHISEHLTGCRVGDLDLEMNLPIVCTEDSLDIYVENAVFLRERLGHRLPLLIEHVPSYFTYKASTLPWQELYRRFVARTGCGILLDLHNLYCDELNTGEDARGFIDSLPSEAITEVHLAGGARMESGGYVDAHDSDVPERVFELLEHVLRSARPKLIVLEREHRFTRFERIFADLERIHTLCGKA